MGDARIWEPSEPELFYLCNFSLLRTVWARQTHSTKCFKQIVVNITTRLIYLMPLDDRSSDYGPCIFQHQN